jgi:hypothetical protein
VFALLEVVDQVLSYPDSQSLIDWVALDEIVYAFRLVPILARYGTSAQPMRC